LTTPGALPELLGVILAAGKGSRIAPFSEKSPKPVLPILGKPLLAYQIETLRDLGVRRILIVVGHLGFRIVQEIGDGSRWGVEIEYVDQGPTLGIAHAVAKLESKITGPFMLFLGDIFFVHHELASMVELLGSDDTHAVLAVKEEPDPEAIQRNFAVLENERGFIERVIEKPRYPRTRLKGCGLYLFDPVFFDAVRRTPRTAMRDEYEITDAIQILIDDGYGVRAARVIDEDMNVTYPRDLLAINLRALGDDVFLGADVELARGCEVRNSVVMDRARVRHPITIERSLIFPDTDVATELDVRQSIVMPEMTIDCR
jgi:glucose-1-phosphate thymidylyltransferase